MSAEELVGIPQGHVTGAVAVLDPEDALGAERAARARAEERYAYADRLVAKLQSEQRDLLKLRDNFHSLYREERELRAEAERVAEERSIERDNLDAEMVVLRADLDRLDRMVQRLQANPAPQAPATPAADGTVDARVLEMERDAGLLRAHAAELEAAIAERNAALNADTERVTTLEREVATARVQLTGSESAATAAAAARIAELEGEIARLRAEQTAPQGDGSEALAAANRRVHDLEGELATLRLERENLQTAFDRAAGTRDEFKKSLTGMVAERDEAQRLSAGAEQRIRQAVGREQDAVRIAGERQAANERTEQELQVAKATIAVLEQRVHDAERARTNAEERSMELAGELDFVRNDVLNNATTAPAASRKQNLLRRRPADAGRPGRPGGPIVVETVGTPVANATPIEVSSSAEDVESALHRRLFGGE